MEIFKIFSITKIYLYKYLILKECWYTVFTVSIHFQYVIYIQSESSLSSSIFFVLYNYFLLLFSFYSMQMSETPQNSYNYFLFNLLCSRYYVTWFNLNFFIYLFVFFWLMGRIIIIYTIYTKYLGRSQSIQGYYVTIVFSQFFIYVKIVLDYTTC